MEHGAVGHTKFFDVRVLFLSKIKACRMLNNLSLELLLNLRFPYSKRNIYIYTIEITIMKLAIYVIWNSSYVHKNLKGSYSGMLTSCFLCPRRLHAGVPICYFIGILWAYSKYICLFVYGITYTTTSLEKK